MLKTRLIALCSALVLTSGLISCSPDKEVKLVNDEMKAGQISAQNADRSFQFGKNIKTLNLSDELQLELNGVDFSKETIYFTVDTQCRDIQKKGNFRKEFNQINSGTFPVLQLIPEDVLLLTKENQVICDFTLTAKNTNTSTTSSQLNNVNLIHPSDFGNWESELTSHEVVFDQTTGLVLSVATPDRYIRLNCDEFGAIRDASERDITLGDLIGDNALQPLQITSPTQNCRALIRQGKEILLSKKFVLKMPFLPVTSVASIVTDTPLTERLYERDVLQVKFQNPNNFPVKLKLVRPNATTFQFQFITIVRGGTGLTPLETRPLRWSWRNPSLPDMEGNFEVILPPNQETLITGSSNMNIYCPHINVVVGDKSNNRVNVGLVMGFDLQTQFMLTSYEDTQTSMTLDIQAPWMGQSPLTPLTLWDMQYNKIEKVSALATGKRPPPEVQDQTVIDQLSPLPLNCQLL